MAAKTADLYITDAVKIDGEHHAQGEIICDVEAELAKELAGQGRARLATEAEVAAARKGDKKAAKAGD